MLVNKLNYISVMQTRPTTLDLTMSNSYSKQTCPEISDLKKLCLIVNKQLCHHDLVLETPNNTILTFKTLSIVAL